MSLFDFFHTFRVRRPAKVRLDVCTLCQLNCPTCHMRLQNYGTRGAGYVTAAKFKEFLDKHRFVKEIELSNQGEVFLNPDIVKILRIGFERGVKMNMTNGVNFNDVSDAALEALVKYKVAIVVIALDGACQETYCQYRRNGDFDRVIKNIRRLNKIKSKNNAYMPYLTWQYVILPSNNSIFEIRRAKTMAKELGMDIQFCRDWCNYVPENAEEIDMETGLHFATDRTADRSSMNTAVRERYFTCTTLWNDPQINWDGRFFGCNCNMAGDFGGNVFERGLSACMNSRLVRETRRMLIGGPEAKGSPCLDCWFYKQMRERKDFITKEDLKRAAL